jgi:hypothetical protein
LRQLVAQSSFSFVDIVEMLNAVHCLAELLESLLRLCGCA